MTWVLINYFLQKGLYALLLKPLNWAFRLLWRFVPRAWLDALKVAGLYGVGYTLALLPFGALWWICRRVGKAYYRFVPKRRQLLLSNWHHAFAQQPHSWLEQRAQHSCMHMVELGLMGFAWPFWRKKTLKERFYLTDSARALFEEMADTPKARIILVPHFSLTESLTLVPWLFGQERFPKMGVVYRPLNQPILDAFVKKTRERGGLTLLPRSQTGLKEAIRFLKEGNTLVVLFDQSPRERGWLGAFMGRLATTTSLPGKLLEQHHAQAYLCYPQYQKPFSAQLCLERLEAHSAQELIQSANTWLEDRLRKDSLQAQTWLWAHDRWRFLEKQEQCLALPEIPRLPFPENLKSFRLWVILPESFEERQALRPLLEKLPQTRPDIDLRLYLIEGQRLGWDASCRVFPKSSSGQKHFFKKLRLSYPDALLVGSAPGALDKYLALSQAPLRLGYQTHRRIRKGLTHTWSAPKDLQPSNPAFWQKFYAHFCPESSL